MLSLFQIKPMTGLPKEMPIQLHPIQARDRAWVRQVLRASWGEARVISRGRVHQTDRLPGFIASQEGRRLGLATYQIETGPDAGTRQCELVSLDSLAEGQGIGTALVEAVIGAAREAGCWRVWLVTTNDNLPALGFYQKRGFVLVALHRDALAESRRLKASIPEIGRDGIPLRDELELAYRL